MKSPEIWLQNNCCYRISKAWNVLCKVLNF